MFLYIISENQILCEKIDFLRAWNSLEISILLKGTMCKDYCIGILGTSIPFVLVLLGCIVIWQSTVTATCTDLIYSKDYVKDSISCGYTAADAKAVIGCNSTCFCLSTTKSIICAGEIPGPTSTVLLIVGIFFLIIGIGLGVAIFVCLCHCR